MASTARRSIVGGPASNAPQAKPAQELRNPDEENKDYDSDENGSNGEYSSEQARL